MAGKFWMTAALVSAFISLSGAAPEPLRCYWCGPLAEQVHRSRRSAACGASDRVTVCEPGYDYCATVATSPPRVESRYCVKMYQDECYPLFCNSTKTWKMTCPCRGNLCNGPNTARETDAFALLAKLVAKTHNTRIKKRTAIASPHLIKHDGKTKSNITSEKFIVNEDDNSSHPSDNIQSDQPTNTIVQHHVDIENETLSATNETSGQFTTANNQLIEIEIHASDPTEGPINGKENIQPCTPSPSTPEHEHPSNGTMPLSLEDSPIATTTEEKQDYNPSKTTENTNKDSITTEAVQINEAEMNTTNAPFDPTTKSDAETIAHNGEEKPVESVITTETTSSTTSTLNIEEVKVPEKAAEPVNQMQNHVPLTNSVNNSQSANTTASTLIIQSTFKIEVDDLGSNKGSDDQMQNDAPIDSAQPVSTTATTLIQPTTLKDEVKPSKEMPTAEALQQNGSPFKATEKTIQVTDEATTVTSVATTNNIVAMTTPPSRRKNNTSRIYFNYTLIISCFVFLLM